MSTHPLDNPYLHSPHVRGVTLTSLAISGAYFKRDFFIPNWNCSRTKQSRSRFWHMIAPGKAVKGLKPRWKKTKLVYIHRSLFLLLFFFQSLPVSIWHPPDALLCHIFWPGSRYEPTSARDSWGQQCQWCRKSGASIGQAQGGCTCLEMLSHTLAQSALNPLLPYP